MVTILHFTERNKLQMQPQHLITVEEVESYYIHFIVNNFMYNNFSPLCTNKESLKSKRGKYILLQVCKKVNMNSL